MGIGITALAVCALVVGGVVLLWDEDLVPFAAPDQCTATVDGHTVTLDPDQAEHAGLIAAIAVSRGLPARAAGALPSELSGGMAQRAALALAIAPDPRIIIADEPETGLDPVLRRVVTELMLQVAADHGAALLLITHNMDTVGRIADDVVRIGGAT